MPLLTPVQFLLGSLRMLVGVVATLSRYSAIGMSCATLAVLLSPWLQLDPVLAFFTGFFLPQGPLYLWFASAWVMRRNLSTLRQWKADKLISRTEYDHLRGRALRWYADRLYGRGLRSEDPGLDLPPSPGPTSPSQPPGAVEGPGLPNPPGTGP